MFSMNEWMNTYMYIPTYMRELAGWGTFLKMLRPSSRSVQRQTMHFLPRYATTRTTCFLTFCLRRNSRCTSCDLEYTTEFSQRQTTGCAELFLLACYILITRAYECILFCTYNDVCNAECGLQLWNKVDTYLLTYTYIYIYIHIYIHTYIHTHIHTY